MKCVNFIYLFEENLLRGSIATTDQDSRLSWSEHINRSAVKFVGEEDDDRDQGLDDEEVRESPPTPAPVSVSLCTEFGYNELTPALCKYFVSRKLLFFLIKCQ